MKRGFTLVELITVLVIIGIGMGLFYLVLFINWSSFMRQISLIDLQMEADTIVEQISFDGKFAQSLLVNPPTNGNVVTFSYAPGGGGPIQYSLIANPANPPPRATGRIVRTNTATGISSIISDAIDLANSSFTDLGQALQVDLLLTEDVLGRRVDFQVSTQVSPRNYF